ncbi:MAG: hypothetical protein QM771_18815 [Nitrospira sp.]
MISVDVRSQVLTCVFAVLFGATTAAWAEAPPRPLSGTGHAVGVVTGIAGSPTAIADAPSAASLLLKIGDVIGSGTELRVGKGGKLDLLWDHRAVLTLREESQLKMVELNHGQTEVRLHHGTVRIALSYNAGRMTDTLMLQTPLARVVSRGGILEATILGGEGRSLFERLVNAPPVETLRVFEGHARVEPLTGEAKPFALKTGSQVSLTAGTVNAVSEIEPDRHGLAPLPVREEHRALPNPVMRQIVNAQMGVALEVGKRVEEASSAGSEKDLPGTIAKGALLPTSTGLPLISGVQTSTAGGSSSVPSVLSPQVGPPIQSAGASSLGPAQSGGLNTNGLLKQILNEVGKGGKGHGKK